MEAERARAVVDEVFSLYERYGNADYIGEPVSQLEHMSQAASLAAKSGADDELILAAFFHDIGHICVARNTDNNLGGFGTKRHEQIGAEYLLNAGFPARIAILVENHVQAKRYLTHKVPTYFDQLSDASRETLKLQGGPMLAEEAITFEKDPHFLDSLLMRRWDEQAKDTQVPISNLKDLKKLAISILTGNRLGAELFVHI